MFRTLELVRKSFKLHFLAFLTGEKSVEMSREGTRTERLEWKVEKDIVKEKQIIGNGAYLSALTACPVFCYISETYTTVIVTWLPESVWVDFSPPSTIYADHDGE